MSATALRKTLFQTLDKVVSGEPAEFTYKGKTLRISTVTNTSKLSKSVKRGILLVNPDSIVESDTKLMDELEEGWQRDDERL